jgi:hypothetical protein
MKEMRMAGDAKYWGKTAEGVREEKCVVGDGREKGGGDAWRHGIALISVGVARVIRDGRGGVLPYEPGENIPGGK